MVLGHPITRVFKFLLLIIKIKISQMMNEQSIKDSVHMDLQEQGLPEVFSKKASIGVGVISTDNHQPIQIKFLCCFFSLFELHM